MKVLKAMLGGRRKKEPVLYYYGALRGFLVQDLSKRADVKAAMERLQPRVARAVHDWLIVGKALGTVARDYGLSRSTLVEAKEFLKEALEDYE